MRDAPTDYSTAALSDDRSAGYLACIAVALMAAMMAEPSDIDSDTDSDILTAECLVDLLADDLAGQMVAKRVSPTDDWMVAQLDYHAADNLGVMTADKLVVTKVDESVSFLALK